MGAYARAMSRYYLTRTTWLIGGFFGSMVLLLVPTMNAGLMAIYDDAYPPVSITQHSVTKLADEILVDLTVEKRRDCELISRFALATMPDGTYVRIRAERADGAALGSLEVGQRLRTTWRIYPLLGTRQAIVRMRFDCSGRNVSVDALRITL